MNIQTRHHAQLNVKTIPANVVRFILIALVVVAALLVARPVLAQEAAAQEQEVQTLLVRFHAGTTPEMRDALIAEMGGELVTWMAQINVAEVRVPVQAGVATAAMPAAALEIVAYAEQDMVVAAQAVYDDPDLGDETMRYGLADVAAIDAWDVLTGSPEIVIAVLDTGIMLNHPEFEGRLVPGYDFVNDDDLADDDMGHGTHVAGIIAAALGNGQGVAGVCPGCRLMPVKVLNHSNVGSWSQLAQGVLFAVDNGARVINLSLGASIPSETMAAAVQYAVEHNVVVVAAAGNNAVDTPFYPAALDGVVAVGATTMTGELWPRSNYGSYIDVVAPGSLIYSTYYDLNNLYHGYTFMSGTSMAAPFVSGVVGLVMSANPDLTTDEVMEAVNAGAQDLGAPGWDAYFGNGRVNAMGSLMSPVTGLTEKQGNVDTPVQVAKIFLPVLNNN